ncbi:hypothetical protein J2128_002105 [Methanomicrobium sp. W14]|uniref:COG1361 S-layer family protein n=1 Tax=Methanomicrobium sp. W14 TaxID=2817839 RepID=UPI001AE90910|nr:COG1361 S-layer family protein [Methanomicrobium sp. W14]MBP2134139.1 hypothetical protein [Methanomicrobium sp. W14]
MSGINTRTAGLLSIFLVLISALAGTALCAGEEFLYSQPSVAATILGSSEVYPGDNVAFTIVVENHGVDNEELRGLQYMETSINPTTSLGTTLDLQAGNAPLRIKTEPFMVGDLKEGGEANGTFYAHVDENAPKGVYNLTLYVHYTYAFAESLIEGDRWNYVYKDKTQVINLPVTVKGAVKPEILSARTTGLSPGEKGNIIVTVENSGYQTGYNAGAKISGVSGIIRPVDGSVFLGDFAPGQTKEIVFSAVVNDSAGSGTYPETIDIVYTDEYGKIKDSVSETFGINISKGAKFRIVSGNISMTPGDEKTVEVSFLNYGDETAYGASARIVPDSPVDSTTDTAILGDIKPGDTKTAEFRISMDSDALIIPYGINTEIKYRDESDNLILSDQMKLPISANNKNEVLSIITNPISLVILAGAVFLVVYYSYRRKGKL